MAGTEHRSTHEPRRFVTRQHVEDAKASGDVIHISGRDVLTDEAAQRAADLGVTIERSGTTTRNSPHVGSPATSVNRQGGPSTSDRDLRAAVRAAVVAELGSTPAGLDDVIDRVLKSRAR